MTKKETKNIQALQDVCEQAVSYVGMANYSHRESHALWNVIKAFEDFQCGKEPQWTEREVTHD